MPDSTREPTSTEPAHLGPVAGGNLRASDADREQVSTVLSTAYAEGRITREEHDERLEAVLRARTFDDLMPLTEDLVPRPTAGSLPAPLPPFPPSFPPSSTDSSVPATADQRFAIDTGQANGEVEYLVGIFGAATRKGSWRVRKHTSAFALFGGIDLDLREATFEAPVVEISGVWCFGGLDIKVPAGIEVRDQTVGIFGGSDVKHVGDPAPGAPVLVIKGLALFGGVSVSGPKPDRRSKRRGW